MKDTEAASGQKAHPRSGRGRYHTGMIPFGPEVWDRMVAVAAADAVRDRLRRSTAALEAAGVPYAVIGGNAVAAWVARVDPAAVRNTQDVDILLRRADLPAATVALEAVGFVYRHAASVDLFLDGPAAKARDAVHVIFANEKVRAEYAEPAADVTEVEASADGRYRHLGLGALVRMELASFRLANRLHLRDFAEVGLIDATWPAKYPPELAARLQQVLDTPDG